MTNFVSAVLWLVLSPLAAAIDVITALVLLHYYPFYHGTDVLLFSAMIAMTMNAVLIPPIPALLEIASISWNSGLCQFYVWAFITFRVLQILTILCITVLWSSILKASSKGKRINFTGIIKGVVSVIWITSGVVGLLPIIGAVPDSYHSGSTCYFMSSDQGTGFAIFIGILITTCMLVSWICTCDVILLLNYVRKVALVKYGAGRFYLPRKSEVPGNGTYTTHERYHQLTIAWDLCKLASVWSVLGFMTNHLPYTVVEFISLTGNPQKSDMEEVVIWLVLVEALCLPNILWCISRRYRHALIYTWRVHVLKHPPDEEEDPMSCTLRSYCRHRQNGVLRGPTTVNIQTTSASNSLVDRNSLDRRVHPHTANRTPQVRGAPEEARGPFHEQQTTGHRNGRVDVHPSIESQNLNTYSEKIIIESRPSSVAKARESPLSVLSSASPTQKYSFLEEPEVLIRTASSTSRREWKEQMRKKHLPPIFVNEAFDADEANRLRRNKIQNNAVRKDFSADCVHHGREDSASQQSLHFYMSGDYHHDNLNTDSLPRNKHISEHKRSESDGICGQYAEEDIEKILDTSSVKSAETMYKTGIKHMSSFHAPADEENKYRKKYSKGVPDSNDNDDTTYSQQNLPDVITDGVTSFIENKNPAQETEMSRSFAQNTEERRCLGSPVVTMNTIEEVEYSLSYLDPSKNVTESDEASDVFKTDFEPYGEFQVKLPTVSVHSDHPHNSISVSSFEDEIKLPPLHNSDFSTSNECRWNGFANNHGSKLGPYSRSGNVDSPRSNISTPVSFTFDEDTDKGFEEALSVGCPDESIIYSVTPGVPFDPISEAECSVSNPFQECDISFSEDNFKTHAVVSTRSIDSRSTTSSENPFDCLPPLRTENRKTCTTSTLLREKGEYSPTSDITLNSTTEPDYGDSGFNSGLDSALPLSRDVTHSPWPTSEENRKGVDMCFESNFSSNDSINQNDSVGNARSHTEFSEKDCLQSVKPLTAKDIGPVYF